MRRDVFTLVLLCGLTAFGFADPIKSSPRVDVDKIAKACADQFIDAVCDGKLEEAFKLCSSPFRHSVDKQIGNLDDFKNEFKNVDVSDVRFKTNEPLTLDRFNKKLKEHKFEELDVDTIKDYEKYLGKEGRIVALDVKTPLIAPRPKPKQPVHLLIRVTDGKAQIVGLTEE